jgi:hypothetical protein
MSNASTWLCGRELHVLRRHGRPTVNLTWVRRGYEPDGSIRWQPHCRACDGLSCPQGHDQDAIVSLPTSTGEWRPACLTCEAERCALAAACWSLGASG